MQVSEFQQFSAIMTNLLEYHEKPVTDTLLDSYWDGLRDWPLEEFTQAAKRLKDTFKYMPKIAEFNDLRNKATKQTAGEVFGQVHQWLVYSPNGYTLNPMTPSHIAKSIMACGGANQIAMCSLDNMPFLEKRFCQHYEQISEHEEVREALPESVRAFLDRKPLLVK